MVVKRSYCVTAKITYGKPLALAGGCLLLYYMHSIPHHLLMRPLPKYFGRGKIT